MFNKRNVNIDIMRGIAIIVMVMGHCITKAPLDMQSTYIGAKAEWIISIFDMPLFFIISGYVFNFSSPKKYYVNKTKRILVPYLIWALIDVSLHSLPVADKLSVQGGYDFLPGLVGIFTRGDVLWFLYVLFEIMLFYPLIFRRKKETKILILIILAIVRLFIHIDFDYLNFNNLLYYLIFFIIGDLLKNIDIRCFTERRTIISSLVFSFLIYSCQFIFSDESFVLQFTKSYLIKLIIIYYIYLIVVASKDRMMKIRNYVAKCGYYSLQIYIFNFYTIMICRYILYNYLGLTNMFTTFIILVAATLSFSTFFTEKVIEKNKLLKFVVGIK